MANQRALYNDQSECKYPHHITLPCPWSITAASESSSNVSYYALLIFPSKNIPINTAAPKNLRKTQGKFKIRASHLILKIPCSSSGSTLSKPPSPSIRHPDKIPTKKSKQNVRIYRPYYYLCPPEDEYLILETCRGE